MKTLGKSDKTLWSFSLMGLISVSSLAIPQTANAAILNGSFESNFADWQTGGVVSIETAGFNVNPTDGLQQALANTTGTPLETDILNGLEDFLGVSLGIFNNPDDLFFGVATEGSAIYQDFTANAGDTLSLDWNFLTSDTFNPDYAFIVLAQTSELGTLTYANLPKLSSADGLVGSSSIFDDETAYQPFSFVIPTSGDYRLGIGVVDVFDVEGDSGVLVDNVRLIASGTTTPEPSSLLGLMMISGLGLMALAKTI